MKKQIANEWLKLAKDDLDCIELIKEAKHLTNVIAFHSQQAIEKSLKAYLEFKNIKFSKIHSLERLFELSDLKLLLSEEEEELIIKLDKLYIDSRYPGDLGLLPEGKPTIKDVIKFSNFANYIYELISMKIKGEK